MSQSQFQLRNNLIDRVYLPTFRKKKGRKGKKNVNAVIGNHISCHFDRTEGISGPKGLT